ncbi:MAG: hypothetical protein Q7J16_00240 [Candidatus Cloacimonadales bacterium]|nr:hypothetical protein [Candidatus Cloacimonadales bacterium]
MNSSKKRVYLIGVFWGEENKDHFEETMVELRRLADTAELEVIDIFSQHLNRPNTSTYIGKGKLKEISMHPPVFFQSFRFSTNCCLIRKYFFAFPLYLVLGFILNRLNKYETIFVIL